jgi:Tol biopolymer transport system component
MNRFEGVTDELIQATFERRAQRAVPTDLRAQVLAMTASAHQRAAWRVRLSEGFSAPALRPAWVAVAVLAALLGVALALFLVGQRPPHAHSGLLAYASNGDIYLANADGTAAVPVVHDDGVSFFVGAWSPDGRRLTVEAANAVYVLDPATLELRRVASGSGAVWSSDSATLAVAGRAGGRDVIDIITVDGGTVRQLQPKLGTNTTLAWPIAWSPDGRWFLGSTDSSACATNFGCSPTGGRFVRIDATTGDTVEISKLAHLAGPDGSWSPDSRRFSFTRPDAACQDPPCQSTVEVEDANLSGSRVVSDPSLTSSGGVWSPNGEWIAFSSTTFGGYGWTLSIVRPDGTDRKTLVDHSVNDRRISALAWTADGSAIEFSENDPSAGLMQVFAVQTTDGSVRSIDLPVGLESYARQAIPAGLPVPTLAIAGPSASPPASVTPVRTPPAAAPAAPAAAWTGIAVDAYCSAAVFDFATLAPRLVETACPESAGPVVFAPQGGGYAASLGDGTVAVVGRDGKHNVVFTTQPSTAPGPRVDSQLAWSPDGRWLSVVWCLPDVSGACSTPESLVVSRDGTSQQRLPDTPAWSPDGSRLAVKGQNGDLLIGAPDGSALHSIGNFPMPASWAPDGSQFAFTRDGDAWIVNADGTNERNVTHFAHGGAGNATWSPDGGSIAVIQDSRLWVLRLADGQLRPVDLGPGRASFFRVTWSPDSARLAAVLGPGDSPATVIIDRDDLTVTLIGGDEGIESISWSPDARFIALMSQSDPLGVIDIANADGSGRHTIWNPEDSVSGRMTWVP